VSHSYVSRIESGDRLPSLQAIITIARRLDTTPEAIVYGGRIPAECVFCGRAH
jgi:transcriptional regulator with XRE-family HTH domain